MYIGKEPIVGNFQKCDAITVVNGQAAYTLQVSSTNVVPESANHMLVSLNGILQAPVTSFTVSGSTLTFASNLATGDVIDFVILLGNVLDLGVPSDGTVTAAKLSGVTQGISQIDQWRLTSNITSNVDPIASNLERTDDATFSKLGSGMSVSSGVWTFPATGLYEISTTAVIMPAANDQASIEGYATSNTGSAWDMVNQVTHGAEGGEVGTAFGSFLFNCTNTSTHQIKFAASSIASGTEIRGSSNDNATCWMFKRIGESQ